MSPEGGKINYNFTNTGYCQSLIFVNLIGKNRSHFCFICISLTLDKLSIILYGTGYLYSFLSKRNLLLVCCALFSLDLGSLKFFLF